MKNTLSIKVFEAQLGASKITYMLFFSKKIFILKICLLKKFQKLSPACSPPIFWPPLQEMFTNLNILACGTQSWFGYIFSASIYSYRYIAIIVQPTVHSALWSSFYHLKYCKKCFPSHWIFFSTSLFSILKIFRNLFLKSIKRGSEYYFRMYLFASLASLRSVFAKVFPRNCNNVYL